MRPWLRIALLGWVAVSAASAASQPLSASQDPESVFPLKKGTVWVYEGVVRGTVASSNKKFEKKLSWRMEIVDTVERGSLVAAVVKGHPADLAWYDEETQPGDYLIAREAGKFYLVEPFRVQEARRRLGNAADELGGLLRDEELFLDWPLAKGNRWGEPEALKRDDLLYQWVVEEERPVRVRVKGVEATGRGTQYRLALRTLPDHTLIDFVPGLGITHYIYSHHGTLAQAEVELVEYRAGQ